MKRQASFWKLLCSVYAALFSAHQEALHEGAGDRRRGHPPL